MSREERLHFYRWVHRLTLLRKHMRASSFTIVMGSMMLTASWATVRAQPPASVLAGVYTEAQATRGEKVYTDTCTVCHGPKLTGDLGPGLVGNDFIAGWKDKSVGDLLDTIMTTMPSNAPGTLTPQQSADSLAYVLSVNKYPAGQTDLDVEVAPLKSVKMAPSPNP